MRKAIRIIAAIVLVVCLVVLAAIGYQYWSQSRAYDDLAASTNAGEDNLLLLSDLDVDWDALREINPDIVAWVYVPDTDINYPVVQGSDNEEYLNKSFDGSTGWLASAGTIFLDAANSSTLSDRNMALYGHHMNDGSMFACLADWNTDEEFNKHRTIYVLTPQGNYRLKTFAYVVTTGDDAIVQTTFASDESYRAYIQDKLDRSSVNQTGTVLSAEEISQSFLFATCEYTRNDGRAIIFASVMETTVPDDKYLSATTGGVTDITSQEGESIASQTREDS